MDLARDSVRDSLDASGEHSEMATGMASSSEASPGTTLDAAANTDDEPVLGPVGRRLLVLGVIAGVVILVVLMVWLMGMLAYTSPPVPGAG